VAHPSPAAAAAWRALAPRGIQRSDQRRLQAKLGQVHISRKRQAAPRRLGMTGILLSILVLPANMLLQVQSEEDAARRRPPPPTNGVEPACRNLGSLVFLRISRMKADSNQGCVNGTRPAQRDG